MDLEKVKQFLEENKEQEEVKEYLKLFGVPQEDYDAIVSERDELLQFKPKKLSEQEQALHDKQNELFKREVSLTLQEKGLEQFSSVINVNDSEELKSVISALEDALKEYKVDNSYVPTGHNNDNNLYEHAKQKGDTQGMIKSLFGFK